MKLLFFLLLSAAGMGQDQYQWETWKFSRTTYSSGWVMRYVFLPDAVMIAAAGSLDQKSSYVQLQTTVQHNGVFTFDWEFFHMAGVKYSNAEVYFNSTVVQLQDNNGHNRQKGTFITPYLRKGTRIGFRAHSSEVPTREAVLVVSNFRPPAENTDNCRVEIYPNPVQSVVRIQLGCLDGTIPILIYDIVGRLRVRRESNQAYIDQDMSGMEAGMYVVVVGGRKYKIVKQ